jgi:hypothetical protein
LSLKGLLGQPRAQPRERRSPGNVVQRVGSALKGGRSTIRAAFERPCQGRRVVRAVDPGLRRSRGFGLGWQKSAFQAETVHVAPG